MSEAINVRMNSRQSFPDTDIWQKKLTDLGISFVSELLHKLLKLHENKLEHARLKHPQLVGVVEHSHNALRRISKVNTNEQWEDYLKYVQLTTFSHVTSYPSAIGCGPAIVLHVREPIKPSDLRFGKTLFEGFCPKSEYVFASQDAMNKIFLKQNSN